MIRSRLSFGNLLLTAVLVCVAGMSIQAAAAERREAAPSPRSQAAISPARSLTLAERVEYQRRVEQVYWSHTLWPSENPRPKPALSEVVSDEAIQLEVENYLLETAALETYWNRRITGDELQAEMDRMARSTRSPDVLRELFAALDDDPYVIAECLARPAIADRLIRDLYSHEERFHGEVHERARQALAGIRTADEMKTMGGEYAEVEVVRDDGSSPETGVSPSARRGDRVALESAEWDRFIRHLEGVLEVRNRSGERAQGERLPVGIPSGLTEETDGFHVQAVLAKTPDGVRVASVRWPKQSFDAWWLMAKATPEIQEAYRAGSARTAPASWGSTLPAVTGVSCQTSDTWLPTSQADPRPHSSHTAVWTGTEMIIWGGRANVQQVYEHSGARYNPTTDTWVETSTAAGVPEAREGHTAVWTGTEMIVWGGFSETGPTLNTGGRYSPASDTWVQTSTGTAVPTPRGGQTAVWTGTEMIVWGGTRGPVRRTRAVGTTRPRTAGPPPRR